MTAPQFLTATAIIVATSMSQIYAGPCAQEIDRVQAKIDARLEAKAAAGLSAPESHAATAHHQPTPESIAAAEGQLGDLPPERVPALFAAMGRARDAERWRPEPRREIVAVSGDQPHSGRIPPREIAKAIVLDFLQPAGAGGRVLGG